MSRGLGQTQRAILASLVEAAERYRWQTVADLAATVGRSDRQVLTAVRALERRGLVKVTRERVGWKGWGETGPLIRRGSPYWPDDAEVPTAELGWRLVRDGTDWHYREVELIRAGMPVFGLGVALPDDPDKIPQWMRNADELRRSIGR